MATPTIQIDQATLGAGTPGQSRDDGVLSQVVTLTDPANGVGTYAWELIDTPPGSSAALSGASSDTATFTPDVVGTYLVKLTFNGTDESGTTNALNEFVSLQGGFAVKHTSGLRQPAAKETKQFDADDGWQAAEYANRAIIDARLPSADQKTDLGQLDGAAEGTVFYADSSGRVTRLAPGTTGQNLQTQGAGNPPQWATPAGGGDVVGPASATDDAVVTFDGTTGKLVQDSGVLLSSLESAGAAYTCDSGIAVGDAVYLSAADTVALADADDASKQPLIGFVASKPTATSGIVKARGELGGFSGLTIGVNQYLSTTPGQITETAPSASGSIVQKVGFARNPTTLVILIDRDWIEV